MNTPLQPEKLQVIQNLAESRFEIHLGDAIAVLDYQEQGDDIVMLHVGVPLEFRGQGIAALITQAGLDYAKQKSLRVIPLCSYVAAYLRRTSQVTKLNRSKET
ncbi:MAG: N-acetyltransferase [Chloroflexi bacterium]|nr:N-acetyltransferase [Chloroflexota bacterium]